MKVLQRPLFDNHDNSFPEKKTGAQRSRCTDFERRRDGASERYAIRHPSKIGAQRSGLSERPNLRFGNANLWSEAGPILGGRSPWNLRTMPLAALRGIPGTSDDGAGDEIRTRYLHLGKVALCQMSYARRSRRNSGGGASGQSRTGDTRIFSPLLYQLSYRGIWRPGTGSNRRPPA